VVCTGGDELTSIRTSSLGSLLVMTTSVLPSLERVPREK
jgi:hypothetical protein